MFYTWRWLPPILGVLQGIGASLIAGTCDWAEAGRGVTVSRCHNADIFFLDFFGSMLRLWSKFSSNHLDTAAQEGCFTKWFRLRLELSCGTFQHFHCGLNLKTFASPSLGLQSAWNWESRHLHLVGSASLSQSWGFVGFWLLRSCPKAEHVHIRCQEFFFWRACRHALLCQNGQIIAVNVSFPVGWGTFWSIVCGRETNPKWIRRSLDLDSFQELAQEVWDSPQALQSDGGIVNHLEM